MFTIRDCNKCDKDYMYHSSDYGRYEEFCQECYEENNGV